MRFRSSTRSTARSTGRRISWRAAARKRKGGLPSTRASKRLQRRASATDSGAVECDMRTRTLAARTAAALAISGVVIGASRFTVAQSSDIKEDYARAFAFRARIDGTVHNVPDLPTWLDDGRFWYRRTVRGGAQFVVVDAATARKQPLFDHARLAAALSSAAHAAYG